VSDTHPFGNVPGVFTVNIYSARWVKMWRKEWNWKEVSVIGSEDYSRIKNGIGNDEKVVEWRPEDWLLEKMIQDISETAIIVLSGFNGCAALGTSVLRNILD